MQQRAAQIFSNLDFFGVDFLGPQGQDDHNLVTFQDLVGAGEKTIWAERHPWLEDMAERVRDPPPYRFLSRLASGFWV